MAERIEIIVQQNDYLASGVMPVGCHDMLWEATVGEYDLGCVVGRGRTVYEAVRDLLDQIED